MLAAATLCGCSGDGLQTDNGGDATADYGTLLIANLEIECVTDQREPEVGVSSANAAQLNATRAGEEVDINTFNCQIINEKNEIVMEFLYADRPTEAIELPTGGYTFKIYSDEVPTEQALWNTPIYGKNVPFKISRKTDTTLSNIVCTLMQIQVSVSYSADLRERLSDTSYATVTVGSQSLKFDIDEKGSGFFYAPADSNEVEFVLTAGYSAAANGIFSPITVSKTISNVKPGQHSDIHLYAEHSDTGTITISTQIKDWVVDDEIGTFDISTFVAESIIDENAGSGDEGEGDNTGDNTGDPNTPTIVWQGYGYEQRYPIVSDTTVEIDVTAPLGIKEFLCTIKSEVLTPDQLWDNNLCDVLNLCDATKSYDSRNPSEYRDVKEALDQLNIANGDAVLGKTKVHLSITTFMPMLKMTGKGKHDFIITVTDNEGVSVTQTLLLVTE